MTTPLQKLALDAKELRHSLQSSPAFDPVLHSLANSVESLAWDLYEKEMSLMTTPQQPQKRIRINVETSVKGVKSWSCTVEYYDCSVRVEDGQVLTGSWLPAALADSDRLVAELSSRYPREA